MFNSVSISISSAMVIHIINEMIPDNACMFAIFPK